MAPAERQAPPCHSSPLEGVEHPEIRRSITDLGMVRGVVLGRNHVHLSIALLAQGYPLREVVPSRVVDAVAALGVARVTVDFTTLTDTERSALRKHLQAEVPPDEAFTDTRASRWRPARAACASRRSRSTSPWPWARMGKRVARPRPRASPWSRSGSFVDEGTPVIWRGPMLHKLLRQFVDDVWWGRPDVLLVDMPPGTGDVSLTLSALLPTAELVVVTTPQPAAQREAQRTGYMGRRIKIHIADPPCRAAHHVHLVVSGRD